MILGRLFYTVVFCIFVTSFMAKHKQSRDEIIEGALVGGVVGAALGAIITGQSKGSMAAMLVGAAIGAAVNAKKEADEFQLTRLAEIDGKIYRISPDGTRKLVKSITRTRNTIPDTFTLG